MTAPSPHVVFVGLDAFDPGLLRAWAATGDLPTLAGLLRRGAAARMENPPGLYVGAVWPSLVTALSPARHGRYCWRQLVPGTYREAGVSPASVRGDPFWRPLGAAGKRVAVFDLPKTEPDPRVPGVHLVDWGAHDGDPAGVRSWPPALAAEVVAAFGSDPLGPCDQVRRTASAYAALSDALIDRIDARERIAAALLGREPLDLLAVGYTEAHCVGHQCWHLHDAAHKRFDPALAAAVGDPVLAVYRAIDASLSRLIDRVGPETTVVVLASHGMGPHHDGGPALDAMLELLEERLPRGRPPSLSARLARLVDRPRTRRWSRRLRRKTGVGLPLPSRNAARTCYAVPNNDAFAGVRVNLAGREPSGRIRPGAEVESFLQALSEELLALTDGDTGEPAFARVLLARDLYEGPCLDALPDLMPEWRRETPIGSLVSPWAGRIEARYRGVRTGDHTAQGLLLAAGPGVIPGESAEPVSVMDVAPTLCALLGVPWPGVDGLPIPAIAGGSASMAAAIGGGQRVG